VSPIGVRDPFLRATVTNFFFCASVNGFVLLPLYIQALGGTEIEIGLVMGLYSGVGIVCQPLIGPWVDVAGRKPFMVLGVCLLIASAALALAAPTIPVLALGRVLQGVGFSAFFVANFSYVIDLVPPARRGWALGIYGVSGMVSTAIAPLLGEWTIRWMGFRALCALALALAVAALAFVIRLREPPRRDLPPGPGWGWMPASFVGELAQRHMVVALFFGLGTGTIFAFLPTFAENLGVRTLALFYTAYAGAAMAVRIVGGQLIDTLGRRAVIVPSMFVQASAVALLAGLAFGRAEWPRMPALPIITIAGLMSGGAHGFLYPGLAALVTDQAPEARRAAVVGVFSAMLLAGQTGGAMVFGYVAHGLGYALMWTVLAQSCAIGSLLSLALPVDRVRDAGVAGLRREPGGVD
jgi:MFS family permease